MILKKTHFNIKLFDNKFFFFFFLTKEHIRNKKLENFKIHLPCFAISD